MALPVAAPGPRRSHGHADGRYAIEVRVGPEQAQTAYESWTAGSEMPVGTTLIATHHDRRRGRTGPIYAMRKEKSGWDFAVLSTTGMRERVPVDLCERCHVEAGADHIFGPPRQSGE